jgi:hypothetical protein
MSKYAFRVVSCTSNDEGCGAGNLEALIPDKNTRGWSSERFCQYPQVITLQFARGEVELRKLQFLIHQFKIPKMIELHAGACPQGVHPTLQHAKWSKLGHIKVNSNAASNYKARELCSVYVKCSASFLRLVIGPHYGNELNIFDQVGVMLVAVSGPAGSQDQPVASLYNGDVVDLGTARQVEQLQLKKQRAIEREDYDAAKQIQLVIQETIDLGRELGALELRKRNAVRDDDFDEAKNMKKAIEQMRAQIARQRAEHG